MRTNGNGGERAFGLPKENDAAALKKSEAKYLCKNGIVKKGARVVIASFRETIFLFEQEASTNIRIIEFLRSSL